MHKPQLKSHKVFKIHDQEIDKYIHLHREYDAAGNKLKEISYSNEEEIVEEKIFTYNSSGQLMEEKSHYAADEVTELLRFEYDEKGRISKTHKSYGEQGDEDTTRFSYNESGMLIEKRTESTDGELEQLEIWKYQGDKLLENVLSDYDGKILESSKFKYNDKGALAEELRYTSETEQELKIIYDYLIADNFPDTTVYNKAGNIVQRTRHTFDEKQRLVKEVTETVNNGIQKFKTSYVYDEQDNRIESILVDKNENLISKILYKHNNYNLLEEEIHYENVASGMELRQTTTQNEYEFY